MAVVAMNQTLREARLLHRRLNARVTPAVAPAHIHGPALRDMAPVEAVRASAEGGAMPGGLTGMLNNPMMQQMAQQMMRDPAAMQNSCSQQ